MAAAQQSFFWYELMTSDVPAAQAFYTAVVEAWSAEPFGGEFANYIVLKIGDQGVAGMMAIPEEAKATGLQPRWIGYIFAPDVDAAVDKLRAAGGKVHREPQDLPGVGRMAVVADPQGATFNLMTPQGTGPEKRPAWDAPGMIGWRELYTDDREKAFDFYSSQFGWTKDEAMDMGVMGTYQLFKSGGDQMGGMMTRPPQIPHSFWGFYFIVTDIDSAARRVTENGGQITMGPVIVPGDAWIVQGKDPQGAMFALSGPRAK